MAFCIRLLGATLTALLVSAPLHAQLATYNFSGLSGTPSSVAGVAAAGLTASSLTRGPGLTAASGVGRFGAASFTTASSIDTTDYFTFTLTPSAGQILNVTDLAFSERRSATGIRNIAVRSSLDNFSTSLALFSVPDDTLTRRQSFSLGGDFAHVTNPLEFRIYGYGAEAASGTWGLGINAGADNPNGHAANLIVSGAAYSAPEPSTGALGALGLGLLLATVRPRRTLSPAARRRRSR
jgi:hypothetical protein